MLVRVVSQNFELHRGKGKESDTVLGIGITQLCQLIPYDCDSLPSVNTIPSQMWELPFFRNGEASGGMPK